LIADFRFSPFLTSFSLPQNSVATLTVKSTLLPLLLGAGGIAAQNNASTANGCNDEFSPGTDTVIFTVPYTYAQVMSIIGDYQNLT
jgi:hypothetical protein